MPAHIDLVVVNQHRKASAAGSATLLTLVHAAGSLTVTSNHVLWLDGGFLPARAAVVGSVLSNGLAITAITKHVDRGRYHPRVGQSRRRPRARVQNKLKR